MWASSTPVSSEKLHRPASLPPVLVPEGWQPVRWSGRLAVLRAREKEVPVLASIVFSGAVIHLC